ncbi:MAG: PrsW family intramembrane metalloprotease [Lachnospiraceae bacterium]|nr:PrsW family intramembrane metalloprotease [Lachnospiraceae bacterium]
MFYLAIIPSIILLIIIIKSDKIEKEPASLLIKLFIFGGLTTITAMLIGWAGTELLSEFVDEGTLLFAFVDNFFLTALVEEGGKYFVLKKTTWKHPAFNYTFDAVVYAVCASLGFATIENILYLIDGSVGDAIGRGLLAVPGHAIDAVFMGYYYGMAKLASAGGDEVRSKACRKKALIVPMLLHGFYDFCLGTEYDIFLVVFFVFEIVITVVTIKRFRKLSKEDRIIYGQNESGAGDEQQF